MSVPECLWLEAGRFSSQSMKRILGSSWRITPSSDVRIGSCIKPVTRKNQNLEFEGFCVGPLDKTGHPALGYNWCRFPCVECPRNINGSKTCVIVFTGLCFQTVDIIWVVIFCSFSSAFSHSALLLKGGHCKAHCPSRHTNWARMQPFHNSKQICHPESNWRWLSVASSVYKHETDSNHVLIYLLKKKKMVAPLPSLCAHRICYLPPLRKIVRQELVPNKLTRFYRDAGRFSRFWVLTKSVN